MTTATDYRPGFRPLEYYLVIAPDEVAEKIGSLFIPSKEEDKAAVQRGTVVAVSPLAFNFADGENHGAHVGETVLYDRYAGTLQKGADGRDYRLVRDKHVIAVVETSDA